MAEMHDLDDAIYDLLNRERGFSTLLLGGDEQYVGMTSKPIRISRKEFSSNEALDYLDEGRRVIVTVGKFGVTKEVILRKTGEKYICDTGVKLMTYNERDAMKKCIERLQLARSK